MTVFVETNFVLEHALEQEQYEHCEALIRLAANSSIRLMVPAFSLAEPHIALSGKQKLRSKLSIDLQAHLADLGRSRPFSDASASFSKLGAFLTHSAKHEKSALQTTIARLLETARTIPLDSEVLRSASELEATSHLSAQDAIVLASVLAHLAETKPSVSCFLNRNTKDFDDPRILGLLGVYQCKLFGSFRDGLGYIRSRIS